MKLPQSAIDLLNHPQAHATVVTLNRDGSPQTTLVWVEAIDGTVSFNTTRGRQKPRNLERDPRIAVSVQNPENLREYAVFEGTARMTEAGADEQIDRLAQKYLGQDKYPWRQPTETRLRVDVDVTAIKGMGPWIEG
jgi:PPOX class probable F420-dependent enzyme